MADSPLSFKKSTVHASAWWNVWCTQMLECELFECFRVGKNADPKMLNWLTAIALGVLSHWRSALWLQVSEEYSLARCTQVLECELVGRFRVGKNTDPKMLNWLTAIALGVLSHRRSALWLQVSEEYSLVRCTQVLEYEWVECFGVGENTDPEMLNWLTDIALGVLSHRRLCFMTADVYALWLQVSEEYSLTRCTQVLDEMYGARKCLNVSDLNVLGSVKMPTLKCLTGWLLLL